MKEARIVKVPNNGGYHHVYRYYSQVKCKFLWFEFWKTLGWSYEEDTARITLDMYIKTDSRKEEIIPYP